MKRLGLLLIMLFALVCVLAISACAVEIAEWTEITVLDGMSNKSVFGDDGTVGATSRVLMADGKTFPSYYICKDLTTLGISYTELNKAVGKTYAAADVLRIELPKGILSVSDALKVGNGYKNLTTVVIPEGATALLDYCLKSPNADTNSNLVSVTIPSTVKTIGKEAFYCCNSLTELIIPEGVTTIPSLFAFETKSLRRVVFPSTITSIGERSFRNSNLSDGIIIPEGCTTIDSYAFKGSKVTSVVIPSTLVTMGDDLFRECKSLKEVYYKAPVVATYMFGDCGAIEKLTLENTIEIKGNAFYYSSASALASVVLPETVTSIGTYAFARASITELVIPQSVTAVGTDAFKECKSLEKVTVLGNTIGVNMFYSCSSLKKLYITSRITSFPSSALTLASSTDFTVFLSGENYEYIKSISGGERITNATCCSYEDYLTGNYKENKYKFVYSADICSMIFDGHTEDNNPCIVNCTRCAVNGVAEKNPVHNEGVTINYQAFHREGTRSVICTNEGCAYKVDTSAKSLFNYLGHSKSQFTDGSLALGYTVNFDAVNDYKSVTGKNIAYGIFVTLASSVGQSDIVNENGEFLQGVIHAGVTNSSISTFTLKLTGFNTDEKREKELVLGAYVITDDGEKTEISYMQSNSPSSQKYFITTFNNI